MEQHRVIELVEQFRVERGQAVLEQLVGLIASGCQDQQKLRNCGLTAMYWFANVVADDQKEQAAAMLEEAGYPEAASLVRASV